MLKKNLILFALFLAITIIPLVAIKDASFEGADGQAESAIQSIAPDYEPWFAPIIEPSSGEIESLLFAVQAAVGAGAIAYYFGYKRGKNHSAGFQK